MINFLLKQKNYDNKFLALFCVGIFISICIMALIVPELSGIKYDAISMPERNMSPNTNHWFGTDSLGRDLWTRIWYGTRITIIIAIFGAVIPQIMGCIIGSIAGYFGGLIDSILMAIVDICTSIPSLIYITLLYLILGPGIHSIIIAISISSWMETARLVRSRIMQYKNSDFVIHAKLQGATSLYIIFTHIFPNIIGQIIIKIFLAIPSAIFIEAYLSFIGMGVASPSVSLGLLCKVGVSTYRMYPYQLFFPSIILSLIVLSFYILGNIIRNNFDFQMANRKD